MTENFEALKTIDLTDDDLFIVQDKETGFKQKLTKAALAAAIGGGGGGGGWTLIERQTIADMTSGASTVPGTNIRGAFLYDGLDALSYTQYMFIMEILCGDALQVYISKPDFAIDIDTAAAQYDQSSYDVRASGTITNNLVVTGTPATFGFPDGMTALEPIWLSDLRLEFHKFDDGPNFAGYNGNKGSFHFYNQNWDTDEKCASVGAFSQYSNPANYLAGNKLRNFCFFPNIGHAGGGSEFDLTGRNIEIEATLYGLA